MEVIKVFFRILSIILFILLPGNNIKAQENIIVSGTILSVVDNKPLSDINIEVEGVIGLYETANQEGRFSIEVPSRDVTLLFSYPGYMDLSFYLNVSEKNFLTLKRSEAGIETIHTLFPCLEEIPRLPY